MHKWNEVPFNDGVHICSKCNIIRFDYQKNRHRFYFEGDFQYLYTGLYNSYSRLKGKYIQGDQLFYTFHPRCE